ncbi:DsbA family protein [Sandaracinus amylolyticus]|uniref:DsbA family protein n=1 Tax=Sandaracinus amylolyticus TaxID=927083 RepID=UPI001F447F2A|nr:thioredoxin domain-containing protein [Sandaracinus amylolyticus]UJR82066.1 Periplasmic thiol:disulfide interchange protein DsbA [Sandaracinus amylolyticus]
MASKSTNNPPVQPTGTISTPSAVIAILIAFVGGLMIGNLTGRGSGAASEEIEMAAGDRAGGGGEPGAGPAVQDDVERFRALAPDNAPQRGPDDALVTIVMWSDFQCPFCSRVEPTLDRITETFGNDVRVVWRNNALPFHQNAMPAAEAAMEAYAQRGDEGFWRMHNTLFENQRALERANLEQYAQQQGLDMTRFRAALDNHTHQAGIQADMQAANSLGARGTPAFFINGRQLMGAQPFEQFETVIRDEIQRANRAISGGTPRAGYYAALMRGARTAPAAAEGEAAAAKAPPRRPQPDPNAVYRVPVGDSPTKGPNDALVTIVIVSEFQCPFCNRVRPTLDQIEERYGRDVRFVFKHNPLPFHDNAMPAAEAAVEAYRQRGNDAFWRIHDLMFENQQALGREQLEGYAQQVGLDMARFRRALDEHTHRATIEADQTLARQLGASGTPSFFINGRNLRGAQPFEAFQQVIDAELARARERVSAGTPRAGVYEATIANGATSPVMLPMPEGGGEEAAAAPDADRVYDIAVPRNAPTRGAANAPVTIQIFSDFQCPFCGRVGPTLEQVMTQYEGRVRLVWRNYPLPFHQQAGPAAEAAMEVFAQRGSEAFWQFHNTLFENQRALAREDLERYATQIPGIDMARFRRALDEHTHQAAVQADMEAVRRAGAEIGTPSFFINGRLLQGAQPFPAFQQAIDRALREAPARR